MRPLLTGAALVILDQLSKWVVVAFLPLGDSIPVWPGVFHLTYVRNTGAAFGMLPGMQLLFIALALAVVIWIWRDWRRSSRSPAGHWGGLFVASGAVGNCIDRLAFGYVIDFLDFRVWPVFNLADSLITVGVALLIWQALREPREEPASERSGG